MIFMTNILGSLWIKGHWLKSGYFLWAWGDMGEGRAGSWRAHTQREEWLGWHPVCSHPGVLRQLLFEEEENIVITGPMH